MNIDKAAKPNWALRILGAIMLLIAGLLGTITWLVNDTERVRRMTERVVTHFTDRPFHIDGDFDFTLGRIITVSAQSIKWDNATWSSQPTMLTIEDIQASVDLFSLFSPPILLTDIVAKNARLDFDWNSQKVSNWLLVSNPSDDKPEKKPLTSLPLLLNKADLSNIELYFRHPGLTEELLITVGKATQAQNETNHLELNIDAVFDDQDVAIKGFIGPFPQLVVAGAIDLDLQAKGPSSEFSFTGQTEQLATLENTHLKFTASSEDVAVLFNLLKLPPAASGKLALKGQFETSGPSVTAGVSGDIGQFNIDSSIQSSNLKTLENLKTHIHSTGPSVGAAGQMLGITGLPNEPYSLDINLLQTANGLEVQTASFNAADAHITASGNIPDFPKLNKIDLDLQGSIKDISRFHEMLPGTVIPKLPLTILGKVVSGTDGVNDKVTATVTLGKNNLQAVGYLTEKDNFAGSKLSISATSPSIMWLDQIFNIPIRRSEALTLNGDIRITPIGLAFNNVAIMLNDHKINLHGDMNTLQKQTTFKLKSDIQGQNLSNLLTIFISPEHLPELPYNFSTELVLNGSEITIDSFTGNLGIHKISSNGSINIATKIPDVDLQLAVRGKNLANLLSSLEIENGPPTQYSIDGHLLIADSGIRLRDLQAVLPDSTIAGTIDSAWPEDPDKISFNLSARGDNLRDVLTFIPEYEPAAAKFDAQFIGSLNDDRLDFKSIKAEIGAAELNLQGALKLSPTVQAENLSVQFSGPHLPDVGVYKEWQFVDMPFNFSATVGGSANKIQIDDFSLTAGSSDIKGVIHLDVENKPKFDIQLSSTNLDIRSVESRLDKTNDTGAPQPDSNSKSSKASELRLIPELEIPVALLHKFDAEIDFTIDHLLSKRYIAQDAELKASLQDGGLTISQFTTKSDHGSIQAGLSLLPAGKTYQLDTNFTGKQIQLNIDQSDTKKKIPNPAQDINFSLKGSGNTLRELAATLDGYIWLRGSDWQLPTKQIGFLFGDFLNQVLTSINPFMKKDDYQAVVCNLLFFEATSGVLETSPALLLRTDKLNMASAGKIDLKTEKINFTIETTPRTGIGISASDLVNPFVKIEGTLAKPRMTLNPTGTLIQGSAAVATVGLSIVAKSLYKRWLGPRQPCEKLTAEAYAIRTAKDPGNVPAH